MTARLGHVVLVLAAASLLTLAAHVVAGGHDVAALLRGLAVLNLIVIAGFLVSWTVRRLPDIFWVSVVATLAGLPGWRGGDYVQESLAGLSLIAALTPVLAIAGLGIGRQQAIDFGRVGLPMILIATLVFFGTFFGSAVVADLALRWLEV